MDESEIKKLEKANPIIQVATELGIRIRGGIGKCFDKNGHGPDDGEWTLFFKPAQNTFFCRTCSNIGGGVIDLVCQYHGWDREKALEWLAHRNDFDRMTRKMYYEKGKKKN